MRSLRRLVATVRFRITALAVLAVLGILIVAGFVLVYSQRAMLTDNVDDSLVGSVDRIEELVLAGDLPPELAGLGDDDLLAQILDADGDPVAATTNLQDRQVPLGEAPEGTETSLATVDTLPSYDGTWRLATRQIAADGSVVYVAASLDDVQESTSVLLTSLVITVPGVLLLLGWIIWWLVGRTLRPVEAIRAEVAGIGAGQLDRRVPVPPGDDEVARLARTMNGMLERVDESVKRQRAFVADASHELRSPLTRMRTSLEVDRSHPETANPTETHSSILEETVGLQRLVDDLLRLARRDAGNGAVPPEQFALLDLDELVLRSARRLRAAGRVRVDTGRVSAAQVHGEPESLSRALGNVVDNAARYAASEVAFSVQEQDGAAVVTVADDGPGIPADDHERVFDRFTQLDDARTASSGGTGLGLAIARTIVAAHSGTIQVDPDYSTGTRLVIELPLAGEMLSADSGEAPAEAQGEDLEGA